MSTIPIRVDARSPATGGGPKVDVRTDVELRVTSRLTPLSRIGLVSVILGAVLLCATLLLFVFAFPGRLVAGEVALATARMYVKTIVLGFGSGLLLVLFGTSLYVYGRSILTREVPT